VTFVPQNPATVHQSLIDNAEEGELDDEVMVPQQ
jgi:hypothetical protein